MEWHEKVFYFFLKKDMKGDGGTYVFNEKCKEIF